MKYSLSLLFLGAWLVYSPAYAQDADLQSLRRQAEQGNAGAQTELGYLYHTGDGVERNYAEAVRWYRLAVEQGHPDAQYNLGVAHAFGDGVQRDHTRASDWYRRAAEQGHAVAAFSLGLSYLYGDGVQQNSKQAAEWFRQSAEQGYSRAQVHLGSLHHSGEGVSQDYEVAAYWYRQAAERGNATAQYNLGNLYRAGHGVPRDNEAALHWFRIAAEQGYAQAQAELETLRQAAPPPAVRATANNTTPGEQQVAVTAPTAEPPARRRVSPPLESAQLMDLEPVTVEPGPSGTAASVTDEDVPGNVTDAVAVTVPATGTATDTAEEPEVTGFADMTTADRETLAPTDTDAVAAAETEARSTVNEDSARKSEAGMGGFFGRLFGREPAVYVSGEERVATTTNEPDAQASQQPARPKSAAMVTAASERNELRDIPGNEEWREPTVADAGADDAGTNTGTSAQEHTGEDLQSADMAEPGKTVALNAPSSSKEQTDSEAIDISATARAALDAENYPEALRLLQAQALNGNAAAETMLGDMYFQGRGVEQNRDRALLWYRRAAKRNYADAQFNLGNMYLLGEGVLQDDLKARDWYQKAADQGHTAAARNLANIKRRITEKKRYQPDNHTGPTRQELETAVEESQPAASPTPAGNTPAPRRVVSPPIESQADPDTSTATASEPDKPATATAAKQKDRPESRRIVSPPLETAP